MGLKIWIVNLMLAGLAAVCAIQAYAVWSKEAKHTSNPPPEQKTVASAARKVAGRQAPPESEFENVAVKNLFSAERKEIEPEPKTPPENALDKKEKEPKVDDLKADGKKMYLYGVVIAADYEAALITNPNWKTDKKPQTWVRLGDTVEGFKVATIETDRVVLVSEGNEVEMFLYDKSKPRPAPPPAAKAPAAKASGNKAVVIGKETPPTRSAVFGKGSAEKKIPFGRPPIQAPDADPRRKSLKDRINQRSAPKMPQGYGKFYSGNK